MNCWDLIAWLKAMDLVMMVYRASERFARQVVLIRGRPESVGSRWQWERAPHGFRTTTDYFHA